MADCDYELSTESFTLTQQHFIAGQPVLASKN